MAPPSWDEAVLQRGRASWRKWAQHSSDKNLVGRGVSEGKAQFVLWTLKAPPSLRMIPEPSSGICWRHSAPWTSSLWGFLVLV